MIAFIKSLFFALEKPKYIFELTKIDGKFYLIKINGNYLINSLTDNREKAFWFFKELKSTNTKDLFVVDQLAA